MDLITLMQNARIKLKPFWPLSVAVCLVYGILIGGPPELNTYGELLSILLAGPLQLGLCIFFLKISNGFNPSFFDLFEGFKPLLNVLLAFVVINALTVLGFILLIVPGIIISLGFSMTYYIMAEDPEIQFYEALESSWKIMDGNKMELLLLHLRFIPWYLLGLLFFVIGIFLVVPWHNLCITSYYKLIKQRNNNKIQRTI